MAETKEFVVTSLVGMNTGKPLVNIAGCGADVSMETSDARDLALNLLSCAEAAEQDLCLYRFLTEEMESGHDGAAIALREARKYRDRFNSVPGSHPIKEVGNG